jgi:hypothetical protein
MADMNSPAPAGPSKAPESIVPKRDLKPLFDQVGSILEESGASAKMPQGSEEGGVMKAAPGDGIGGEAEPEGEDVGIIADTLDVSMEKAQALYDAAMEMPKLAGKSPAEVAEMLEKDVNLRMQLEKNIGAGADQMDRQAMAGGEKPPAPMPPPMEPSPAGAMK